MKRRFVFVILFLAAYFAICRIPTVAQVLYGSIVGTVQDSSGGVISKAKITLTSKATGVIRVVETDEGGRYSISSVPPGTYSLQVTVAGFRAFTRTDIKLTINSVTREDVMLEVGQMTEQVSVVASAVTLQTDKSDIRTEITGQTVQNLPLPGYRNYQSLIALVPGASPPSFQNAVVDTPGRALRSFVNGTATNNNNTLTDGAVNINIWLPHHVAYVQPVESIETVNISTGSFDADQGMAGGAAITLTTKSGTNQLHGTGWWYHTNQHLQSAKEYFRSSAFVKPLNILNIGGGNLGGPIKKDKLFYFFNFERTTERTGYTGNYSVAPADFREGNFSQWSQYFLIYDPASASQSANPIGRKPFQNNIIPKERINTLFQEIYKNMPLPNQQSPTDPLNLSGNYFASGVLSLNRNQYDGKMNYNVNKNFLLWGKYSRMDAPVRGKYPFGDLGGSPLGTAGAGETTTQLVTVGYNHIFSSTFLMDGVFGYTRMDQAVGIPNADKNVGLDIWKIPGTNGGRQFANDKRYGGAPQLTNFGFSYIGFGESWTPVFRHERAYTYQTNFSKSFGPHEVRFGYEMRRLELNHWQPETANPRGAITFAAGATQNPDDRNRGAGNGYAAALLGLVSSYSKSIQFFEMKTREWQYAWYVRDRWQVTRNFTLNAGLRYEYYPLLNRGDRGLERWDPATNIVYFGGLGGTPRDVGIKVSKKLFAPRIGLAYRFKDKWVFRAGYGLTYDPLPFGRPLRGLYPATLSASGSAQYSFGWRSTINEGIPDISTPDVSKGQAQLPRNVNMGPRSPWEGMLHRGYIQSFNATVERRLPWNMVGNIAYVGTRTIHQMLDININTVGPGLGADTANLPLAKTQGRTIGMNMWDGWGYASYNSLQATLNKGFGQGLFLKAAYTYGKSLSFSDEDGWAGLPLWNWGPMIRRNYAPSGYDRRHMFTVGWYYELPVGEGKALNLHNKVADSIFGGWKLAGTFVAYTGLPFTVTGSSSSLQCIGCTQTAHLIAPVKKLGGKGPQNPYYDPMSFRDPLWYFDPKSPNPNYVPGSMGRNPLYGPGYWRLNPAFFKSFKITEKLNAEFRAESTNVTNSPIWGTPNGSSGDMKLTSQGTLDTSLKDPLRNFMSITSVSTGREFRFGLRVAF